MTCILLDVAEEGSIITKFIGALSVGNTGAFFVLIFALVLIFFWIIKAVSKQSKQLPIKLIISLSAGLLVVFTSMAFYILTKNENGGKQTIDKPKELQGVKIQNALMSPAFYASLNYSPACEKRDIYQKLSFVSSRPYYVLIDVNVAGEPKNQLALLSIADDDRSVTFRIGYGSEFNVQLNTPVSINSTTCKYNLELKEITYTTESVVFKRKYAHYTLTPIP